jgi:hypothetical protein
VSRPLPPFVRILMDGKMDIQQDNQVISWSGHDICFGHRIDWIPPETPEQTMTAQPPYALVISARAMDIFKEFEVGTVMYMFSKECERRAVDQARPIRP